MFILLHITNYELQYTDTSRVPIQYRNWIAQTHIPKCLCLYPNPSGIHPKYYSSASPNPKVFTYVILHYPIPVTVPKLYISVYLLCDPSQQCKINPHMPKIVQPWTMTPHIPYVNVYNIMSCLLISKTTIHTVPCFPHSNYSAKSKNNHPILVANVPALKRTKLQQSCRPVPLR